jgi:predicted  nucleic acid-binding Zn-ribbon protein
MSISAGEIVKLLKSDKDALRELSAAIASEPELRLAVINAVLADVATKQDLQQLRQELRGTEEMKDEIVQLRQEMKEEIAQLREELRGDITATKQDFQQLRQELREEISQLRQEMTQVRQELKVEIAQLREETKEEIAQLRQEIGLLRQHVDSEISQLRRDMNTNFRWTVVLIIAVWGTTVIPLLMRLAGVI